MEATTYQTAALIDRGAEDYMLETAILKVFSTEALWQGVYETLQVFGGQGYFSNEPYERMMRDARINTIGEGANEVLKAFIALVGMRDIGEGLKSTLEGLKKPGHVPADALEIRRAPTSASWCSTPVVPWPRRCSGRSPTALARRVSRFGRTVERLLITHREAILERQYDPGADRRRGHRAGDLGLHALAMGPLRIAQGRRPRPDETAAELYMRMANRRFDESLRALGHNDDRLTTEAARRGPCADARLTTAFRMRSTRRRQQQSDSHGRDIVWSRWSWRAICSRWPESGDRRRRSDGRASIPRRRVRRRSTTTTGRRSPTRSGRSRTRMRRRPGPGSRPRTGSRSRFLESIPQRAAIQRAADRALGLREVRRPRSGRRAVLLHVQHGPAEPERPLHEPSRSTAEPRVLLDPNTLSADGTVALCGDRGQPRRPLLAYGIAAAGSDWNEWKVRDVATGKDLPDRHQVDQVLGRRVDPGRPGLLLRPVPRAQSRART